MVWARRNDLWCCVALTTLRSPRRSPSVRPLPLTASTHRCSAIGSPASTLGRHSILPRLLNKQTLPRTYPTLQATASINLLPLWCLV